MATHRVHTTTQTKCADALGYIIYHGDGTDHTKTKKLKCDVLLIDVVRLLYARALLLHSELLEVCPLRIDNRVTVV